VEGLEIVWLSKDFARVWADELLRIKNLIPTPPWTKDILLNDSWADGKYGKGKWERSWVALLNEQIVGLTLCWEKPAEEGTLYTTNSLYIQSMAVDTPWQRKGVGWQMVARVLDDARERGLLYLNTPNPMLVTTQTNSADWNQGVINFYIKCGFRIIGATEIHDRTDVVLAQTV